jgi:hypothetical protein
VINFINHLFFLKKKKREKQKNKTKEPPLPAGVASRAAIH